MKVVSATLAVALTVAIGSLLAACANTPVVEADPQYLQKRWTLVVLNGQELSAEQQAKKPYLQLQSQFATAYAGCNRLSAAYQASGSNISFGAIRQTKMACLNNMKFEQGFIDMLAYSEKWSIDGPLLRFYADNPEQAIAIFKAK